MYSKEFVDLCANWIRGSITDKSLFEPYYQLMLSQSFKETGFRIWTFEPEELKNVIFNQGDLEIQENTIESCFYIDKNDLVHEFSGEKQHIENNIIEQTQKWLSPYIDSIRIVTRWTNSDYFDIYKVLEFGINEFNNLNVEYTKDDNNRYTKLLKHYNHQKEILHLGKYNNISSDEIIYLLVSKDLVNQLENEHLTNVIYDEIEDYYIFYNDEETRDIIHYHSDLYLEFNFFSHDIYL